jgi:hypothetical protein
MAEPNSHGVYEAEAVYAVATVGRAYVRINAARCRDGRHRYAYDLQYSYGGRCAPITDHGEGFATQQAARDAAMLEILKRFPVGNGDPAHAQQELIALRKQIEEAVRQPLLL